ncbi:MAG TPA: cation-transporting P-type ATPase [Thermodesulfobacteriota bacterium]|nr:cation-transporting P-type ATPase [Thermodesulfobacteriota bacterium]
MAEARLPVYGPDRLSPPEKRGPLERFFPHFKSVLIYVPLAAAGGNSSSRAPGGRWSHRGSCLCQRLLHRICVVHPVTLINVTSLVTSLINNPLTATTVMVEFSMRSYPEK